MKIKKAVITAGGFGTRLLPATKEVPKEMLPLFVKNKKGEVSLKPLLQIIFEQLHGVGIRDFSFIVGRGKSSVADHFTPDVQFLKDLTEKGQHDLAQGLEDFYGMLQNTNIIWKNQLYPRGFGDAVLLAKSFVGDDTFLTCAGDSYVISKEYDFIKRAFEVHEKHGADVTIIATRAEDPSKYGVIMGESIGNGAHAVKQIIEKPEKPESNLVSTAVYIFSPRIFEALEKVPDKNNGEKELTDAIQHLIESGGKVFAVELKIGEEYLDIGKPHTYKIALDKSFELL